MRFLVFGFVEVKDNAAVRDAGDEQIALAIGQAVESGFEAAKLPWVLERDIEVHREGSSGNS